MLKRFEQGASSHPRTTTPLTDAHAGGMYRWAFWSDPKGWNLIQDGIEWFNWGEYTHVELACPDNETIGATWPRVRDRVYLDVTDPNIHFYDFKAGVGFTEANWRNVEEFMRSQVGKHYDLGGIFGHIVKQDWQAPDKWMCHELCMEATHREGFALQERKPAYRLGPNDMMMSPLLYRMK